jgi:hypothetical protein
MFIDTMAMPKGVPAELYETHPKLWSRVVVTGTGDDDCWEYRHGTHTADGYGRLGKWLTHRLAYTLTKGPIPEGLQVLHGRNCNNPCCVRPSHLSVGTASDNAKDRVASGRQPKATRKLKLADVLDIHAKRELGYQRISEMYPVGPHHVRSILNFNKWPSARAHVAAV